MIPLAPIEFSVQHLVDLGVGAFAIYLFYRLLSNHLNDMKTDLAGVNIHMIEILNRLDRMNDNLVRSLLGRSKLKESQMSR